MLLAVSLEASLDVEGAGTVVAADELSTIFAGIAVISVFDLGLFGLDLGCDD